MSVFYDNDEDDDDDDEGNNDNNNDNKNKSEYLAITFYIPGTCLSALHK